MAKPSQGYYFAKREMVEGIDRRIDDFKARMKIAYNDGDVHGHIFAKASVDALENLRNYVRNTMLWDTQKGK